MNIHDIASSAAPVQTEAQTVPVAPQVDPALLKKATEAAIKFGGAARTTGRQHVMAHRAEASLRVPHGHGHTGAKQRAHAHIRVIAELEFTRLQEIFKVLAG
jgi:hypothetical protein